MTWVDPAVMNRGTPAQVLADLLEGATDAYRDALDVTAEKENDYLKAYSRAFLAGAVNGMPATIRPKSAEVAAVEERCLWNIAQASERACRAKVDELKNRLVAAQSHQKYLGDQS